MAIATLENRTDRLFGRETDLVILRERTSHAGLTVIVGPPQIGKSWLLMELARQLDREVTPRSLVGFTRSPRGAHDPLLQVVSDLYQRWLADASAWEQVKTVCEQQKEGVLPGCGKFVGKLSEKAAKLVPGLGELWGVAIKESLEGLVAASEDLRTGRLIVSRLEYTQAQELVSSVQKITQRRIALVMDQWEESRDLDLQRNAFRDFLREPESWPNCHIFLGAREGGDAAELLHDLEAEFPGGVCVCPLRELDLAAETERRRLISFLHALPQLGALENVPDDHVLKLIGGYPRVISRWTAEDARNSAKTLDGLEQLANDATEFRYRDLEKLLLSLDVNRRKLVVRLALVPLAEDPDTWRALRRVILADLDPTTLDELRIANIIEKGAETPCFGHPTRRDAACGFLDARYRETVRVEAEALIPALAMSVTAIDVYIKPFAAALAGLRDTAERYNLGLLAIALCEAASILLGERPTKPGSLIDAIREVRRSREPSAGLVLAGALVRMISLADDASHADVLLDELRSLSLSYSSDGRIRKELAKGLVATLNRGPTDEVARRDRMLDELRALVRTYPNDAGFVEELARGIWFCRNHNDFSNVALVELRSLARDFPDNAVVGRLLAYRLSENRQENPEAVLDELRQLARTFPDDSGVRSALAVGLAAAASGTKDTVICEAWLDELRVLARAVPDDQNIREKLASGLVYGMRKGDRARDDVLLDELRGLCRTYAGDARVRFRLGEGLLHALCYASPEPDAPRREALLDELVHTFSDDVRARRNLTSTICLSSSVAKTAGQRHCLVDALRAIACAYSDDGAVRLNFAAGLCGLVEKDEFADRGGALDELQALASAFPNDREVREWLGVGLVHMQIAALEKNHSADLDLLRREFCATACTLRDDAAVRGWLVDDHRGVPFDELHALARTYVVGAISRSFDRVFIK